MRSGKRGSDLQIRDDPRAEPFDELDAPMPSGFVARDSSRQHDWTISRK
jgi:hypothetical protein